MALADKHRHAIFTRLAPTLGEEETNALLSQFPARELDEPVTREFVRAELAGLRGELHTEIGALRSEMMNRFRAQTVWTASAILAGMGLAAAIG